MEIEKDYNKMRIVNLCVNSVNIEEECKMRMCCRIIQSGIEEGGFEWYFDVLWDEDNESVVIVYPYIYNKYRRLIGFDRNISIKDVLNVMKIPYWNESDMKIRGILEESVRLVGIFTWVIDIRLSIINNNAVIIGEVKVKNMEYIEGLEVVVDRESN